VLCLGTLQSVEQYITRDAKDLRAHYANCAWEFCPCNLTDLQRNTPQTSDVVSNDASHSNMQAHQIITLQNPLSFCSQLADIFIIQGGTSAPSLITQIFLSDRCIQKPSAPQPQRKEKNQENFECQTSPPESIHVTP
jgi:hypothetical protein